MMINVINRAQQHIIQTFLLALGPTSLVNRVYGFRLNWNLLIGSPQYGLWLGLSLPFPTGLLSALQSYSLYT